MKNKVRYYHTKDESCWFGIFKQYSSGYIVRYANGKMDLAAGDSLYQYNFSLLRDAIHWTKNHIATLER